MKLWIINHISEQISQVVLLNTLSHICFKYLVFLEQPGMELILIKT